MDFNPQSSNQQHTTKVSIISLHLTLALVNFVCASIQSPVVRSSNAHSPLLTPQTTRLNSKELQHRCSVHLSKSMRTWPWTSSANATISMTLMKDKSTQHNLPPLCRRKALRSKCRASCSETQQSNITPRSRTYQRCRSASSCLVTLVRTQFFHKKLLKKTVMNFPNYRSRPNLS